MSTIPTTPPPDAGDFDDVTSGSPPDPLRQAMDDTPRDSLPADPSPAHAPEPEPEAEAGSTDREYLVFVRTPDKDDVWIEAGVVTATNRQHAKQTAFADSEAMQEAALHSEGLTLVAVPARFWNPTTVRTRTEQTTDWS